MLGILVVLNLVFVCPAATAGPEVGNLPAFANGGKAAYSIVYCNARIDLPNDFSVLPW
jgi:hypothetical protein